jgi:aminoglycoside phosphotransferase (APT) family kinase protein
MPGTPMAAASEIDGPRLGRYLAGALADYDPAQELTISLLTGGRSNLTYLLAQSQPDRRWVLRRPPLGHIMPTAHDMEREYRTLSFLSEHHFPSPEPLALCRDESVLGVRFQVLRYIPGLVISDAATARGLAGGAAGHLCQQLIDTLARLHQIRPPPPAAGHSTSSARYLQRQVTRWTQQWPHTKTRDLPAFDQLSGWLQDAVRAVPEDRQVTVVHGDYRLDNLVLDPDSLDIRAVLDWEMSTLGDPLMDLALLLVYWQQGNDVLRKKLAVAQDLTTASGFWSRDQLVAQYSAAAGQPADSAHLTTCLALACLKLAVVMESIHYRHLAGQALDQLSAGLAEAAPALLEMGLRAASGQGVSGLAG